MRIIMPLLSLFLGAVLGNALVPKLPWEAAWTPDLTSPALEVSFGKFETRAECEILANAVLAKNKVLQGLVVCGYKCTKESATTERKCSESQNFSSP